MSEYRNFERCVLCRTKINLRNYVGQFEETMLINSLYIALMYPIEKRRDFHLKSKKVVNYLDDIKAIDRQGNSFTSDDIVRYLRNSLAHYTVAVESDNKVISKVKLWGINQPSKASCDSPCENQRCLPKQYESNSNGEICTFIFSIKDLREFTYFILSEALSAIPSTKCAGCAHIDE